MFYGTSRPDNSGGETGAYVYTWQIALVFCSSQPRFKHAALE